MFRGAGPLAARRARIGLSLADLRAALPSHPSEATLSRFERGGVALRLPDAAAYADKVGLSLEALHKTWMGIAGIQLYWAQAEVREAEHQLAEMADGFPPGEPAQALDQPAVRGDGPC